MQSDSEICAVPAHWADRSVLRRNYRAHPLHGVPDSGGELTRGHRSDSCGGGFCGHVRICIQAGVSD